MLRLRTEVLKPGLAELTAALAPVRSRLRDRGRRRLACALVRVLAPMLGPEVAREAATEAAGAAPVLNASEALAALRKLGLPVAKSTFYRGCSAALGSRCFAVLFSARGWDLPAPDGELPADARAVVVISLDQFEVFPVEQNARKTDQAHRCAPLARAV
ncbi:MAG: hypothetical protein AMXMBFR7_16240 [Planctomycetota bacterium]